MNARACHYVLKIGNRKASYEFFTKVLQMKVLRHEEFGEGCKAKCNGPYKGKWSKTMIGYGSEDNNFVFELTYNYEIASYTLGNDLVGIFIESDELHKSIDGHQGAKKLECGSLQIADPDGHNFLICAGKGSPKVVKVAVRVQCIKKSIDYWSNQLGMKVVEQKEGELAIMSYGEGQCRLEVRQLPEGTKLNRASGHGRIAFAIPEKTLPELQSKMKAANLPILEELTTLETPGKASVKVVILADPDEHEICFVGDEKFRELSKVDPQGDELIRKEIEKDTSSKCLKEGKKNV